MKKSLLLLWFCILTVCLFAQNGMRNNIQNNSSEHSTYVTAAQALDVGYAFMNTAGYDRGHGNVSKQAMQLVYTGTAVDGTDCYYVFSLQPTGFVIVAADERAEPILGYSYDNPFMVEGMPDNVRGWLDHYREQIKAALDDGIQPSTQITEKWALLRAGHAIPTRSITAVSPLLQTTWDQNQYYNQYCPSDANGPGGHAYAGCVATAMAQIIRYWQWPNSGFNSHSYTHNNYGTLSVDFGSVTHNYNNMPNSLSSSSTSTQKNAVATLIYHCGVAVDMDYAADGSAAYTYTVPNALYNYFAYAENGTYVYRPDYSDTEWSNMIKQELNNSRPVFYAGSGSGGHAFVCDGYDNNGNFHFNWGWSGSYNSGYYALDALTPGSHNYSENQEAIIGISVSGAFMRCSTSEMLFAAPVGEESEVQTLSVRGHSLSANINVTVGSGFKVSSDGSNYSTSASLPSTGGSLYLKYIPTSSNSIQYTMTLTSGTCSANVTLHGSVATEVCLAPKNLTGTHNTTSVNLSWNEPVTYSSGSPASAVLSWETNSDVESYYGYSAVSHCMVHRFVPSDLNPYNQYVLKSVSFIGSPYATSYSVVVYKGGSYSNGTFNPGQQIVNQTVPMSMVSTSGWNTVTLMNPVLVNASSELWFGIVATGDYVIPAVSGNLVSNKGNVLGLKFEGNSGFGWYNIYTSNFPLKGTVEKISGQVSHYDVYRQSTLIGNTTNLTYTDSNPLMVDCQYTVAAVWSSGCSEESVITVTAPEIDPPTVTTNNVTNIAATTANCGGRITSAGGARVTARGVCWSTSQNPTINNNHTTNGSGTGNFISTLTELTPSTTYYVRAYATNAGGTSYGAQKTFTTLCEAPVVSISGSTTINYGQSTTLTASGAASYVWSNGSTSSSITVSPTSTTTYSVTGTNQQGCAGTESVTVTVNCLAPTVTTKSVTNITKTTATCSGRITSAGGATVTARGICWSTSHNPTLSGSHTTNGSGTGSFTSNLTDLMPNTTYYVRAYATNSVGTSYGSEKSFKTDNCSAIALPYSDSFDGYTTSTIAETGIQPTCWDVITEDVTLTDATKPQVYYNSSYATSGSYTLRMKNRCVYAMPELSADIPVSSLTMTFNLRQPKTVYRLQVGVLNANGVFQVVKTINNASTGMEEITVDFSSYTGSGHRIAFRNTLSSGSSLDYSINYIDDIALNYTLSCGINELPYTESFDSYTTSTTNETRAQPECWEVVTEEVALTDATKPQVYYNSSYATSGSYTLRMKNRCVYAMPELSADIPVSSLTMTFNLRQPKSVYRLQVGVVDNQGNFEAVKTINNATTGTEGVTVNFSNYAGNGHRIAFRNTLSKGSTLDYSINYIDDIELDYSSSCKIRLLPYAESFDAFTTSTTAETGVQPECWEVVTEDVALTDATKPQVFYSTSYATSGSYLLRMKNRCVYAMPELSSTIALQDLTMTFKLRQPKSVYRLQVGVVNGQGIFEVVKSINNASTGMENITVDFSNYNGSGHRIAFRNTLGSGSTLDYSINYIDDINITRTTTNKSAEVTDNNADAMNADRNLDVKVYPNPTKEFINVECTMNNVQCSGIEVIDVYGKVVCTIVGANNYSPTQINVSGLAVGMYFVRVTTDRGAVTKPFVKR